ncbi:MAG TPA: molybdenum cofactor biosynthesis protein MoaE [Pseudomonadales bacterium]|nr:molybdenum cofactor biosynthesis protein MoaE [Pseudomonadales bacterium]
MTHAIVVDEADFDPAQLLLQLHRQSPSVGAVASFIGVVRAVPDQPLEALHIEHYPGMTEAEIGRIVAIASQRWPIEAVQVYHRVGRLALGERIVWVAVSAAHRRASFAACEFIMDFLKTRATFWKKECFSNGERWVEQRQSDLDKARDWQE